ncbi:MAG: tRNA lysidine(34) synthetase TilS [Flavobacteriales bacterium]|nr:tRNA lysidine(34) synthetase TilS [Flavobacteriales bacterium]
MPWVMLDEVRRFIKRERLLNPGEAVLLAVSGGVDSMVLTHVMRELDYPCMVLHMEHGLRGSEGEADCAFVEEQSRMLGVPCRSSRVDAAAHAKEKGISIQMAARELRYAFINATAAEFKQKVAMAHHSDDAAETLLIHLLRGTGSQGWSSIKPRSGAVVRPLLCVDRAAVLSYAQERGIRFREDSSNAETKYLRNRIRHELVPLLDQLRPGARRSMGRSTTMLRELTKAAEAHTGMLLAGVDRGQVPFKLIEESVTPGLLLHELLAGHGFHPDAIDRIRDAIADRSTGASFFAGVMQVTVDREALFIGPVAPAGPSCLIDPSSSLREFGPFRWFWSSDEPLSIPTTRDDVVLDADCLAYPLELRPWRRGDRMRPIGLGGSKLVSDILIDAKVPRGAKLAKYVLTSGGDVVWLAGHCIGEGYPATLSSRNRLRICLR